MRLEARRNPVMKPGDVARVVLAVALSAGLLLAFAHREAFNADALRTWVSVR